MATFKQRFERLTPERKKIAVLSAVAFVGFIGLFVFVTLTDSSNGANVGATRKRTVAPESTSLIGKSDTTLQAMGLPALSERVTNIEKAVGEIKASVEKGQFSASVPEIAPDIPLPGLPVSGNRATLRSADAPPNRINVSPPSNAGSGAAIPAFEPQDNRTDLQPSVTPRPSIPSFEIRSTDDRDTSGGKSSSASDIVNDSPMSAVTTSTSSEGSGGASNNSGQALASKSPTVRPTPVAAGDRRTDRGRLDDTEQVLPSGSMLSGVMLTGLDAPTSNQGRRDPIPVLVRVKSEAILPNRFSLDLRECFLLASGYGDLSSERAYLRAERLSCVREDGKVIDTTLDATLQGRDGKAGLRGRVVHKNGQLIANSLMTGFLSGFSSALGSSRVPTLNLTPTSNAAFESAAIGDIARSGAMTGVGNAVGKIADYYLEMGRSIFPVIEIDAGQEVDFIVTAAQKLKLGVSGGATFGRAIPPGQTALTTNASMRRITR